MFDSKHFQNVEGIFLINYHVASVLTNILCILQDCYILDTVTAGIFVWIGKQCTKDEKVEAMKRAQKFLTTNNYPVWTKVFSVIISRIEIMLCQYVIWKS